MKKLFLLVNVLFTFCAFAQESDSYSDYKSFYPRTIKANFLQIPFGGGSLSYEVMRGEKTSAETGITFRQGRSSFLHENPFATQTSFALFFRMTLYFTNKMIPPEGLHGFIYGKYAFHSVQYYHNNLKNSLNKNEVNVRTSTVGLGLGYQKRIQEHVLAGLFVGGGFNPAMNIQIVGLTYPPGPDAEIFLPSTYIWDLICGLTIGYNF